MCNNIVSYRNICRASDKNRRRALWLVAKLDAIDTRQHLLKENTHLESSEMLTETNVDAMPKCHGRSSRSTHPKLLWAIEDRFVTISRQIAKHEPIARRNAASIQFGFPHRCAHEMLYGSRPAYCLLNKAWNETRIFNYLFELVRLLA